MVGIDEDETVACLQVNVKEGKCCLDSGWGYRCLCTFLTPHSVTEKHLAPP